MTGKRKYKTKHMPIQSAEREKTLSLSILYHVRSDLIEEASTLFAGSTDAELMCKKIREVFAKYV